MSAPAGTRTHLTPYDFSDQTQSVTVGDRDVRGGGMVGVDLGWADGGGWGGGGGLQEGSKG